MIYELKCDVCYVKTGELELLDDYIGELSNTALGFSTIKCDSHKNA